jgi:hypothetical protein
VFGVGVAGGMMLRQYNGKPARFTRRNLPSINRKSFGWGIVPIDVEIGGAALLALSR